MYFGQTIPAGYILSVTSWENDGDNYQTEIITGISTLDEVKMIETVLEHISDVYGNDEYDHSDVSGAIKYLIDENKITEDVAVTYFEYGKSESEMLSALCSFLSVPIGYEHDWIRVLDSCSVSYMDKEFTIPIPKEISTTSY